MYKMDSPENFDDLQNILKSQSSVKLSKQKTISKFKLIEAWETGILSDKAYVWLILTLFTEPDNLRELDVYLLSRLWEGVDHDDGKLPKQLKPESINKAIIDIEAANLIRVNNPLDTLDVTVL
jgi:hypothetical protein